MANRLVIELTTKYNDGDMAAKVYQEYTDNVLYFKYTAKRENLKRNWVLDWGKVNNMIIRKKVNKRSDNITFNRMYEFFNANKNDIVSNGVIFENCL